MTATVTDLLRFEWARHRSRGELLDLILEIEERLRVLVRTVLQEAARQRRVEPWTDVLAEYTRGLLAQRRPRIRENDLLDRATLSELVDIALNQWDHLGALLGERCDFHSMLEVFRNWRNRLAHGEGISDEAKVEVANIADQVARRISAPIDTMYSPGSAPHGAAILWVDDEPEGNLLERRVFRLLGIDVVPVRNNDEAIDAVLDRRFDVIISDIERAKGEAGSELPRRLHSIEVTIPVLFYVGTVDPARGRPAGSHSIHEDPTTLIRDALSLLTREPGRN